MGRVEEGKTLAYVPPVAQLRYWHKSMARMAIAGNKRPGELAQMFGLTPAQVTRVLESPLMKAEMNRLQSQAEYVALDMSTELQMRQRQSLNIIDEILYDDAEEPKYGIGIKKDVALTILDRTGYGANPGVQKHLHLHKHEEIKTLSDEELNAKIKSLLRDEEEGLAVAPEVEFADCLELVAVEKIQ